MKLMCVGVRYATGSSQCWEDPVWVVMPVPGSAWDDGAATSDVYACAKHVARVIDREHGSLVLPVVNQ